MLGLLAVLHSEIKSYVVLLSFCIKMMKGRLLQACSLRHSIKKGMLSVWGKLDLFKSNRGGVLPPPPPPRPLGYAPVFDVNCVVPSLRILW